jgi:starch phosphorylase
LLDTKHAGNDLAGQSVTRQLYGGDRENRMRQEVLLGIGGVRALEALGIRPTVHHMNEGHSAFLVLERIIRIMEEDGLDFAAAKEAAAGLVFTTHTPVPAGHDYFSPQLVERYLGRYATAAGITIHELLALGRRDPTDSNEEFCNTVLGLRTAAFTNGVSELHGEVTRSMWHSVWPGLPEADLPIGAITNGVHFESWVSGELKELYDRYLGPQWREEPADATVWSRASQIPPAELWRIHQLRRDRLVGFARRRLSAQLAARGAPQTEIDMADVVLDPHALTIGFSRRFATYKRATLLLSDPDRLEHILTNQDRPVQIVYAGKAHPQDQAGKELIRSIIELARRPGMRRHLVFIADYDMAVTRYLVQGSDVWLNTPVRPLEASGTSGMKAAANGVLNLSTLDGWWDEAYQSDVGWAIGRREQYPDAATRDHSEAEALYDLLEHDVVPLFYERGADHLPRRWIERVQSSIAKLNAVYNTHRMVREYTERYYLPAHRRSEELLSDGGKRAGELAAWRKQMEDAWMQVRVVDVSSNDSSSTVSVNERVPVQVTVHLGEIDADSVTVELYRGRIDPDGNIADGVATPMRLDGPTDDGNWTYRTEVSFGTSGTSGYTVRVLPSHPDLVTRMIPGLVTWA